METTINEKLPWQFTQEVADLRAETRKLKARIEELKSQVRDQESHIGELQFGIAVWKKRYMDILEWLEEVQKKFKRTA